MTTTDRLDLDQIHNKEETLRADDERADDTLSDHPAAVDGANRPRILDDAELKSVLEALLFVSHQPVTLDRLTATLECVSKTEVRQVLLRLQQECDQSHRGIQVIEVAGGFQLVTRPEHAPWIKQLGKTKAAPKLSRSGLESLAIIAYKQPIVRAEIEQIRGVETSGVLRTLLERKLVRMIGRKEVPGRPILYGTTKYFLQHFGLRDISELPPLREFKELGEAEQAMLPVREDLLVVGDGEAAEGENLTLSDSMTTEGAEQP